MLSLSPKPDLREEDGSLLSFPQDRQGRSAAERHARARARRESRPSDLLEALQHADLRPYSERVELEEPAEPVEPWPEESVASISATPVEEQPSLIERVLRRGKTSTRIPQPTPPEPPARTYEQEEEQVYREPVPTQSSPPPQPAPKAAPEPVAQSPYAYQPRPQPAPKAAPEPVAPSPYDYQPRQTARDDDDESWKPLIDPMRVVNGILDAKGLIVALTVLGGVLGVALALSTPKKFEATAEILIDPRDLKIGDRPLTDVNGLPSDSTIALVENQVRVLTSGPVLNKVVDKLNLESDPDFNGQGGFDLNPVNLLRSLLTRSDGTSDAGRRRGETVTTLAESVSVERTGRTFVVLVHATTPDAEKSALIANEMVNAFLEVSGKMQADSAGRANSEVVAQLDRLRGELEAAEQKVEKYRADNDLAVAQGRLITDDEIIKLNDQLAAARARTIELNARAETARQMSVDAVVGGAIPEAASSSAVNDLRAQYASAKQEADRISVRLGPRHPSYQSAQAQVAAVTAQISTELKRVAAQVQTELRRSVQLEQDLAARLAQLKVRHGDVSNELVMLRDLERDAQAKRSVYEAFLLRANETSEQKEINSANISVISAASPPLNATGTSRAMIAASGALAGLLAGIGIGALRGMAGGLSDTWRENRAASGAPRPSAPQPDAPKPRTRLFARKREDESPVDEDKSMNPFYPPGYAPYPQQPVAQPQPHYAHPGYAQPVYPPQAYTPPPMPQMQQPLYPQQAQHYPPAMPYAPPPPYPPQAYAQPWPQPHSQPVYAQPVMPAQPVYAQPYANPVQQAPAPEAQEHAGTLASITDSVREFRDAVRELTETRFRRRYY